MMQLSLCKLIKGFNKKELANLAIIAKLANLILAGFSKVLSEGFFQRFDNAGNFRIGERRAAWQA